MDDWQKEFLRHAPGPWVLMMLKFSEKNLDAQEKISSAVQAFDDLPLQDQHNCEALGRAYAAKHKVFDYKEHGRLNETWLPEWCVSDAEETDLDWEQLYKILK